MPKKIRRSNNHLRKTNRKGRKTTNRKRLKKFVGGGGYTHWVDKADGHYSINDMKECKAHIDSVTGNTLFTNISHEAMPPSCGQLIEKLRELSNYLNEQIVNRTEWEMKKIVENGDEHRESGELEVALHLYKKALRGFRDAGRPRPKLEEKIVTVRQELQQKHMEEARRREPQTSDYSTPGVVYWEKH